MRSYIFILMSLGIVSLSGCSPDNASAQSSDESASLLVSGANVCSVDLPRISDLGFAAAREDRLHKAILSEDVSPEDERFWLDQPLDWDGEETDLDRTELYRVNAFLYFEAILNDALEAEPEQKLQAYRQLAEWIVSWHSQYPFNPDDPIGAETDNKFAWYDMAAGMRAAFIGHVLNFDHCQGGLEDFRDDLEAAARDHIDYLMLTDTWAAHSNHGYYQSLGLFALIAQAPFVSADAEAIRSTAVERSLYYLDFAVSPEGVHLEHSPMYHAFILKSLIYVEPWLRDTDQEGRLRNLASDMQRALAAMTMPSGLLAPIGDGRMGDLSRMLAANETVQMGLNPYLQQSMAAYSDVTDLSDLFAPLSAGMIYQKVINEELRSFFAVVSGHHTRVHKTVDDASMLWVENDLPILFDAGRYDYGDLTPVTSPLRRRGYYYADPRRVFIESAHAHNTVEIDGESDNRRTAPAYQSAIRLAENTDDGSLVVVADRIRHPLVQHKRILVVVPGEAVLTIDFMDDLLDRQRSYAQWFQVFPGWVADGEIAQTQRLKMNENWVADAWDGFDGEARMRALMEERVPITDNQLTFDMAATGAQAEYRFPIGSYDGERYEGWTSLAPLHFSPAQAIAQTVEPADGSAQMAAIFHYGPENGERAQIHAFESDGRMARIEWSTTSGRQACTFTLTHDQFDMACDGAPAESWQLNQVDRNRQSDLIYRARAAIELDRPQSEIFELFEAANTPEWSPAGLEAADYAESIGATDERLRFLESAYRQGDRMAALNLGVAMAGLSNRRADHERAVTLLREAASRNVRIANYHLGELFNSEESPLYDPAAASASYERGALKGHPASMLRLAELAEAETDFPAAVEWFTEASDAGHRLASYRLGEAYLDGELDLTPSPASAVIYFQRSADKGSRGGAYYTGILHAEHGFSSDSPELAKQYLRQASEAGSRIAQYELAELLLAEDPVRHRAEIVQWLESSAALGFGAADEMLETIGDD